MAVKTRSELSAQVAALLNDNTSGDISAQDLRTSEGDIIDSAILAEDLLDEDDLSSNSATEAPTQQSVKAYVDNAVTDMVETTDTDASGFGWVVDEDNMASDSATKVPTQQSVKAYVDANAGGGGTNLDEAATEVTIASGVITPTATKHTVDTEGDASSDDLDLIDATNFDDGDLLVLRAANDARTVVLKHDSGSPTGSQRKIFLSGDADYSLDDDEKSIILELRGTEWHEWSRSKDDFTEITPTAARLIGTAVGGSTIGKLTPADAIAILATGILLGQTIGGYVLRHQQVSSVSGVLTLDVGAYNSFDVVLTENITSIVFSNVPGSNAVTARIRFQQAPSGGPFTVGGWPSGSAWDGGNTFSMPTTASAAARVVGNIGDGAANWEFALAGSEYA